jgi:hypothetical protein
MKYLKNPFDNELNPIELIWAHVKGFVAKNNTTFRLKDVKELTYAAFGTITKDVRTKAEVHVISLSIILNMIILQPVSSSESSSQQSMIIGYMTLLSIQFSLQY